VIHCDTSFLIRASVAGTPEDAALREWLRARETLRVSAVAWAEYCCGPVSAAAREAYAELLGDPVPFTAAMAQVAAEAYNAGGRRRGSFLDCMVAATAVVSDAALATVNARDFARLGGVGVRLVGYLG
jgi:predicted nucleic acid-binding protein